MTTQNPNDLAFAPPPYSQDTYMLQTYSLDALLNALYDYHKDKQWVLALVEEDIISPLQPAHDTDSYVFNSMALTTVRRAARLQRDFDASPQAIGLILSLLEELHGLRQLRRQVAMYHEVVE